MGKGGKSKGGDDGGGDSSEPKKGRGRGRGGYQKGPRGRGEEKKFGSYAAFNARNRDPDDEVFENGHGGGSDDERRPGKVPFREKDEELERELSHTFGDKLSPEEEERRAHRDAEMKPYNDFMFSIGRVSCEHIDKESAAEFLYSTLCATDGKSEVELFDIVTDVFGKEAIDKQLFRALSRQVQRLAVCDAGEAPMSWKELTSKFQEAAPHKGLQDDYSSEMAQKLGFGGSSSSASAGAVEREAASFSAKKPVKSQADLIFDQAQACLTGNGSSSSPNKAPDKGGRETLLWFREQCELVLVKQSSSGECALTAEELMEQLLSILDVENAPDENALLDLLGFESFEFMSILFERRPQLLEEWEGLKKEAAREAARREALTNAQEIRKGPAAVGTGISVKFESNKQMEKLQRKNAKNKNANASAHHQVSAIDLLSRIGSAEEAPTKKAPASSSTSSASKPSNVHQAHLSGLGLKIMLPEGTKRKTEKGFERVWIPPTKPFDQTNFERTPITELPQWAQVAFKGTKSLNVIQSLVYNAAFGRSTNMLISAPTGAGKTNIALLCILRLLGQHMDAAGGVGRDFKVIYMAPMKALAGEIARKFQKALGPLGVQVNELTGEATLTPKELEMTHVIITVPEKYDSMTRNSTAGSGVSNEGLQKLVQLIIIDEIHLLNEDRGSVVEAVVARTLRYMETSGQPVRLVGISATLPNYQDIANFLRVDGQDLFYFDSSYRPIPLEQTFIGINGENREEIKKKMDEVCYDQVFQLVKNGHQVMVFVHARNDCFKTADALSEIALSRNQLDMFTTEEHTQHSTYLQQCQKSRNRQVGLLYDKGFGMHHAGMLRQDKLLTEQMFLAGVVKVLCCTATLAWGINLPARAVVIKGTSIFDSQKGGYIDLGILDVQQIFGRAGRPGFDSEGSACLITEHGKLDKYLRLLLQQFPIESQLMGNMPNMLNAEISMGNISSEKDAADWLRYTYLFVRMFRNAQTYGVTQEDFEEDPTLEKKRRELIDQAAQKLCNARLIRIDRTKNYNSTDLGRVATRFYVDWETAESFSKGVLQVMNDSQILALFGKAHEFQQIQIRDDELMELDAYAGDKNTCPVKIQGGTSNVYGKVALLLQIWLSRGDFKTFSLVSDCNFVLNNASRLFRALFEITMTRVTSMSEMSDRLLEWCKMLDRRIWFFHHTLRHFAYPPTWQTNKQNASMDVGPAGGVLKENIVKKIEDKGFDLWRLLQMQVNELMHVTGVPDWGKTVHKYIRRVPNLELDAKIQPITSTIMRITLIVKPDFDWSDRWSGPSEPWYIWVENPESQDILHSEYWVLHKRNLADSSQISFAIPLQEPRPPQYIISVVSDRWVGVKYSFEFSVNHLLLPDRQKAHTTLLDLTPLPISVLQNPHYESLYKFTHYNAVQTQVFHTCYHSDYNVLLGAPTGSGKTNVAEMTIFRLWNEHPGEKVIYIAPLKALARERIDDWQDRFKKQLGRHVVELTGDFTPDVAALDHAEVIVTTPEKWDGISRHWQHRAYVRKVGLVIIDEIHLLGQDRGPVLEVIVSRMRYLSCNLDKSIRFVGLSTALANAHDIADWLGIGIVGLFNFKPSVRPVPMTAHIQGYPEKHYGPRMASMNKPVFHAIKNHSPTKPVLVFVSSRRQTRLTALDLIGYLTTEEGEDAKQWLKLAPHQLDYTVKRVQDKTLQDTLQFGIGLHHAGYGERDRRIVEELYLEGKIMVLIATSTLAWGVNFPAHLVVIKGTEFFDPSLKRYVDFPITDVLQMMGRAGRPQFDTEAKAVVMVHEPKKNFYRRFIYEPFPVESSLHEQLTDHLNAEITARTITSRDEAIDYVTWTYFFRRLTANPSYYDQQAALLEQTDFEKHRDLLASYIERLMNKSLDELIRSGCIELKEAGVNQQGVVQPASLDATKLGRIASLYYLSHRTVAQFQRTLSRESLAFIELMRVLCECPEYDELPVRHNEDKLNAEFAENCPLEIDLAIQAYDSPHTKAFLLLQAHMWGLALPISDYKTDMQQVLGRSIPLIQAMVDIAAEEAQLRSTLNLILLLQSLHQASHPWRSTLLCLPHLSPDTLKTLKRLGIESLPELIERKDSANVITQLSLSSSDAHKELLQLVRELPRLRVKIELRILDAEDTKEPEENEEGGEHQHGPPKVRGTLLSPPYQVPPDCELELSAVLSYENQPMKFAYAPRFPKKKTFSWWAILGDLEVDELVSCKRAMLPARRGIDRRVSFQFCSPAEEIGETFKLSVLVMSDSFLGLDQQFDLEITTVDR